MDVQEMIRRALARDWRAEIRPVTVTVAVTEEDIRRATEAWRDAGWRTIRDRVGADTVWLRPPAHPIEGALRRALRTGVRTRVDGDRVWFNPARNAWGAEDHVMLPDLIRDWCDRWDAWIARRGTGANPDPIAFELAVQARFLP